MVSALAVYYFICGILSLFCCGVVAIGGAAIMSEFAELDNSRRAVAGGVVGGLVVLIGAALVISALFDLAVAHGIWHRRLWGRVLALVMGAVNALYAVAGIYWGSYLTVPIYGFLSAYTFFVLFQPEYAAEFQ